MDSEIESWKNVRTTLNSDVRYTQIVTTDIFEGEMAHARFFEEEIRKQMPKCSYRKYTISEILNAVIEKGFVIKRFDEHPAWTDSRLPGEFTVVAFKE